MSLTFFNLRRRQAEKEKLQRETELANGLNKKEEATSKTPMEKATKTRGVKGVKKDVADK